MVLMSSAGGSTALLSYVTTNPTMRLSREEEMFLKYLDLSIITQKDWKVEGCGVNGANHSALQKAALNLIPPFCAKYAKFGNEDIFKYFQKTFNLKPLKGKQLESFLKSLRQRL